MAILNITTNKTFLNKKSRNIDEITPRVLVLLDDMKETLIKADGVGLAAPQVGVLRKIFLIDTGERVLEFINPEIISKEGEQEGSEACLSIPDKYGIVKRPMKVTVRALNRKGKTFQYTGEEIYARALCHEYDHLQGILCTDIAIEVRDKEKE